MWRSRFSSAPSCDWPVRAEAPPQPAAACGLPLPQTGLVKPHHLCRIPGQATALALGRDRQAGLLANGDLLAVPRAQMHQRLGPQGFGVDDNRLDPPLLGRRPGAVSGGELQRLSLLRVLLRSPSFVFTDEPTSRLDPISQARVIRLLTEISEKDGVALMLVSHYAALIRNTADTVLSLDAAGTAAISEPATFGTPVAEALT